jgi:hypothetical protein
MNDRRGFVSVYFLSLFLSITLIVGYSAANTANRLKSIANLKQINAYLAQEHAVLSKVKCLLKNEEAESGTYRNGTVVFDLSVSDSQITATVSEPLYEILIITCSFEQKIVLDYESIRDAEPA